MPDELIIKHCSPTLAGLKPGNIFNFDFESDEELQESFTRLNKILGTKGLRALPLIYTKGGGRAIVYIYRPGMLTEVISEDSVRSILKDLGYSPQNMNVCVAQLMEKMRKADKDSFPHEIGLFLGYPAEDVQGFMRSHARSHKLCGAWKVYGNEERAKKTFDAYNKCKADYSRRFKEIGSIEG